MSIAQKFIITAVSLVLTILFVIFLVTSTNYGRQSANDAMSDAQLTVQNTKNSKWAKYDGTTVSGSDALALYQMIKGQDFVFVWDTLAGKSQSHPSAMCANRSLDTTDNVNPDNALKVNGVTELLDDYWNHLQSGKPWVLCKKHSGCYDGDIYDFNYGYYIVDTAKYKANLLYDINNNVIGFYFSQIS